MAVTSRLLSAIFVAVGLCYGVQAAVLPEDRADAMFHSYSGGGVTIDGPSVLIRKSVGESISLSANYYVDSITSASVDVEALASEYSEERTEYKAGIDYLHNKSIFSFNVVNSEENDFSAWSYHFNVSQDFFGDMSTLTLGYSRGNDDIRKTGDESFLEQATRNNYRLSLTQVLTKKLIGAAALEIITDQGYLNNPYRRVRSLSDSGFEFGNEEEVYPQTRTSTALALRTAYYLSYGAALHNEYRYFNDTWNISAHNIQIKYIQPVELGILFFDSILVDLKLRYYTQSQAEFYSDLFPFFNAQNFKARDKELSQFQTYSLGIGLEFEFDTGLDQLFKKSTMSLLWDFNHYNYDNFRNVNEEGFAPGEEPLYRFSANVVRLLVSFWF